MPSSFDGTQLMTEMWMKCVIPTALSRRSAMLASVQAAANFGEIGERVLDRVEDSEETSAIMKKKRKLIFTFDGCWEQMAAVMKNLNTVFWKKNAKDLSLRQHQRWCSSPTT